MAKVRKVSINASIIIQARGHRKCNPCLLNIAAGFDVSNLYGTFILSNTN